MSDLRPLWQQLGFSSEQDKADYEHKMLGTPAPRPKCQASKFSCDEHYPAPVIEPEWIRCPRCELIVKIGMVHRCKSASVADQAVGEHSYFRHGDLEVDAVLVSVQGQLAAARAEINRLKRSCGQENCMGWKSGQTANWVREERLIEARAEIERLTQENLSLMVESFDHPRVRDLLTHIDTLAKALGQALAKPDQAENYAVMREALAAVEKRVE